MGLLKSKNFIESENINYEELFKPDRVVHKIEDCLVTRDENVISCENKIKDLESLMGKNLRRCISTYSDMIEGEVPVISYFEYLKELKDFALAGERSNCRNLNRLFIPFTDGKIVSNVIVTGYKAGKFILINEVFKENKFIKSIEYDLEELIEQYEKLMSKPISGYEI